MGNSYSRAVSLEPTTQSTTSVIGWEAETAELRVGVRLNLLWACGWCHALGPCGSFLRKTRVIGDFLENL